MLGHVISVRVRLVQVRSGKSSAGQVSYVIPGCQVISG
jgi:hypothetical protein